MARRSHKIVALLAAYALALHGLLAGLALTAHAASSAQFADVVMCSTAAGSQDQGHVPAHDQAPCALHCLLTACPLHAAVPPAAAVIGKLVPHEVKIAIAAPVRIVDRAAPKSPQSPRAPPLA